MITIFRIQLVFITCYYLDSFYFILNTAKPRIFLLHVFITVLKNRFVRRCLYATIYLWNYAILAANELFYTEQDICAFFTLSTYQWMEWIKEQKYQFIQNFVQAIIRKKRPRDVKSWTTWWASCITNTFWSGVNFSWTWICDLIE